MAEQRFDDPSWQPTSKKMDPFLIMHPNSKSADRKGLIEGKLIMDNFKLAQSLEKKQKYLNDSLKEEFKDGTTAPTVEVTYFKNWGRTQEALLLHAKPTSRKEISCLVKAASKYDPPIKVGAGGAYHSWSPMFPDPGGLLINTCDLKLNSPEAHAQNGRFYRHKLDDRTVVTISPGVTVGELMKFFIQQDICFESDLVLPTATYGGILSGGCHGTGRDQTSMSDWIVSLTFVDGKGDFQTISEKHNKPHLTAAQANLGLFGVVVEYTVEVKDMSLRQVQNNFELKLMDAVDPPGLFGGVKTEKLGKLFTDHWSIELFWFPFTGILDWILASLPTKDSPTIKIANLSEEPEGLKKPSQHVSTPPVVAEQGCKKPEMETDQVDAQSVRSLKKKKKKRKKKKVQQGTITSEATLPTSSQPAMPTGMDEEISEESVLYLSRIIENLEISSSTGQLTIPEDFQIDVETLQQAKSSMIKLKSYHAMVTTNTPMLSSMVKKVLTWLSNEAAKFFGKHPFTLPLGFLPNLIGALWLPYMDKIWVRAIDKCTDMKLLSREPGLPLWTKALDLAVQESGNSILNPALHRYPDVAPLTLGLTYQELKKQYGKLQCDEIVKTPWAVHYRDCIDVMPVTDMEFAFPINLSKPTKAVEAIHAVVEITKEFAIKGLFSNKDDKDETNIFPLTLCMELRVIKKSMSLLCPASNTMWSEEYVVYIEVLSTPDTPGYQEYFRAIAKKWMDLGGIPHWQKQWAFLDDDYRFSDNKGLPIFEHIKKNFEKNLKAFDAIRKKYDSDCLFMNKTMARIFE